MGIPVIVPYPMPRTTDLPANQVGWQLDPARAVLLIHDMQRYFVNFFPSGASPMEELMANAARLRAVAGRANVPAVYSAQPGAMSRAERGLLYDFWGAGMDSDPVKRQIVPEVAPRPGDTVLTKWRYSAFHQSQLLSLIRESGRDQLVICGVYAHVGCLMTANDAFTSDLQPFLVADAVADFNADYHHLALRYAAERCAAVVTTRYVEACLGVGGMPAPAVTGRPAAG
jgi:isochorismate hydrolase